jgi:GNAT superfamily N-acetyltransferase
MSPSQILYRKAVEADSPRLVEVHYAAVQALAAGHYAADVLFAWSPPPDEARHSWLASLISRDAVLCTVASIPDGQIAGFCIVAPEESLLRAIYVHPEFVGRGVGRGLLERSEAHCLDRGVAELWLNASYNAEAFYVSCGYKPVGPVTYPLSEETSMGATRMVKSLATAA